MHKRRRSSTPIPAAADKPRRENAEFVTLLALGEQEVPDGLSLTNFLGSTPSSTDQLTAIPDLQRFSLATPARQFIEFSSLYGFMYKPPFLTFVKIAQKTMLSKIPDG